MSFAWVPPTRRAIIIGCPDDGTDPHLPGVGVDLRRWRRFLLSDSGGAWNEHELRILDNPAWPLVELSLIEGGGCDYTLVAFSGHGQHDMARAVSEVAFGDGSVVDIGRLRTGSPRQLIVSDSCRTLVPRAIQEARIRTGALGQIPDPAYRRSCRETYDAAFLQAEEGTTFLYSSAIGQAADETATGGGEFTRYLLGACDTWARANPPSSTATRVLRAHDAFTITANAMRADRLAQRPAFDGGRRRFHFPLAVV